MTRPDSELRRGWPVILVAALGSGLGVSGLLTYTVGIFAKSLEVEFGLTRTQLGGAYFIATVALACALPLVGLLVDRYGPRWPALAGVLALAGGFATLGTGIDSVADYMLVMGLIGFFAAASSPVAYTRAVNARFVRSRGIALGLTQLGIGVSAMLVPPLLAVTVATEGWRSGYLLLAGIALCGLVPVLFLPADGAARGARPVPLGLHAGKEVGGAPGRATFVVLLLAFGTMALAFAGLLTHFVPMMREAGMDAVTAGRAAGVIGGSVIASRVIVGWLSDRVHAKKIAIVCCGLCAAGCAGLAVLGPSFAWIGAAALGIAMGAEADLIGYMVARYFGMARYGRLYAIQYASFMLMAGVSPLWIGVLADRFDGYRVALLVAAGGLAAAMILFSRLPAFPREDH